MNHLKLSDQEAKYLISLLVPIVTDKKNYDQKISKNIYDKLKAVLD